MNYIYLAIVSGLIIGWWFAKRATSFIFDILYHLKYRSKEKYHNLYELMDQEAIFKMMVNQKNTPGTYAEYLRRHQSARPNAYKYFRANMRSYERYVLTRLCAVLVPAVLFWDNWYFYGASVVLVTLGFMIHERVINGHKATYYYGLMQITIMNEDNVMRSEASK